MAGTSTRKSRRRWISHGLAFTLALGLLLWVKLRLVTNVPRSAYAEPEKKHVQSPKLETKPEQATAVVNTNEEAAGRGD